MPPDAKALYQAALEYYDLEELQQSYDLFQQLIDDGEFVGASLYWQGKIHRKRDATELAKVRFETALGYPDLAPETHIAASHEEIAWIYSELGENELAEEHFLASIEAEQGVGLFHYAYGKFLNQQERYDEAISHLELSATAPEPIDFASYQQYVAYKGLGDYDNALLAIRAAVERAPRSAKYANRLGMLLRELGEEAEAEQYLRRATELQPNWWYHRDLARLLKDQDRLAEAAVQFEQAAALAPDKVSPQIQLAYVYVWLGRQDDARIAADRAVELAPDSAWAHEVRGLVLNEMNLFAEAVEELDRSLALNPDSIEAVYYRGMANCNRGLFSESLPDLLATQEELPDLLNPRMWVGYAYRGLGEYELALEQFQQAAELHPTEANPHFYLGKTYAELGRLDEAVASYKEAQRIGPDETGALQLLGGLLVNSGRLEEARVVAEEELARNEASPEAHSLLALYYLNLRRVEEAIGEFELALEHGGDELMILPGLAICCAGVRDFDKARKYAEQARPLIEQFPPPERLRLEKMFTLIDVSVLYFGGDYEAAIELAPALADEPEFAGLACTFLGASYFALGELDLAARQFESAGLLLDDKPLTQERIDRWLKAAEVLQFSNDYMDSKD